MSHVSQIEIEIKSLDILKDACKRMGLAFKENQKTFRWYGNDLGDYPVSEGMTRDELGKCDHAIEVPGCDYDIGVVKRDGQYRLLLDFWSTGGLEEKLGKDAGKLKQAYAVSRIKQEARIKRYRVVEKPIQNGIRLRLAV